MALHVTMLEGPIRKNGRMIPRVVEMDTLETGLCSTTSATTPRCIRATSKGMTNKEIAIEMGREEGSISRKPSENYRNLGVESRQAFPSGITPIP